MSVRKIGKQWRFPPASRSYGKDNGVLSPSGLEDVFYWIDRIVQDARKGRLRRSGMEFHVSSFKLLVSDC